MKNKKLALSVLSTAVLASMASSAFAATPKGFYVGGDIGHFYSPEAFFEDVNKEKIQSDFAEATAANIVYVDEDGTAANLADMFDADVPTDALTDVETAFGDAIHDNYTPIKEDGTEGTVFQPEPSDDPTASDVTGVVVGDKVTISGKATKADKVTVTVSDKDGKDLEPKPANVVDGKFSVDFTGLAAGAYTYEVVPSQGDVEGDKVEGGFTVAAPGELKVDSVSAINAKEIKITFNKEVDKDSAINEANYEFVVNGTPLTLATALTGTLGEKGYLAEDGKSVIFQLNPATSDLHNADKYSVNVSDGVLDKNFNKAQKFADTVKTFNDTAAPQLLKARVVDGTTAAAKKLELTFNEPVTNSMIVKVDGIQVAATNTVTPGTDIEDYTATTADITIAGNEDLFKVGTHTVVVYNASDVLDTNANTASVLTATYTVTADSTAPAITDVSSVNSRSFYVKVSESLSVDPTVVLKKGNYTIPAVDILIAKDTVVDSTGKTYRVSVVEGSGGTTNPLYASGETSVALNATIKDYKDNSNLVGATVDRTVTLSKDVATPKVVSVNANTITGTTLNIKFDGKLDNTAVDGNKIAVRDKDGVLLTGAVASVTPGATANVLNIAIGGATPTYDVTSEPYTVELAAGAVKYIKDAAAATYSVNTNANEALSTTVKSTNNVSPVTVKTAAIITTKTVGINGQILINYGVDMDANAKNVANYKIDGVALPAGTTADFVGGVQQVRLTLPAGSFSKTQSAKFSISTDVKTKTGSQIVSNALSKDPVEDILTFTDNAKPVLSEAKYFVNSTTDTTTNKVKLVFSEDLGAIADTAAFRGDFKVTINGAEVTVNNIAKDLTSNKVVYLTLGAQYNVSQAATITVVPKGADNADVDVVDASGNKLTENTTVQATTYEVDPTAASNAQAQAAVAADKLDVNVTATAPQTLTTLKGNVALVAPATNGSTITWSSSDVAVVSNSGVVVRPIFSDGDANVTLTATIAKGIASDTKPFALTVLRKDFAAAAASTPNATFTITGDGYASSDFDVTNIDIDAAAGVQNTVILNGVTYTVSYDNTTGVATVAQGATAGSTVGAAADSNIVITKDGKTVTLVLKTAAVASNGDAVTFTVE